MKKGIGRVLAGGGWRVVVGGDDTAEGLKRGWTDPGK